ncbi:DinB family protein [Ferruginibacter lapsinanis]|uniref:DinB family protein n=1 Tax=Ferruginibacter lapsinanis TaxID=563172 RepID=UPI001E472A14|nr:DinB family protein [Ferruginibacter lapsinanis]UEG49746.1 DinB family protein [Ferruginibacter lapsinanis]
MSNEINRIVKLFTAMHHGDCWIGVNFKSATKGLSAAIASRQIPKQTNSIWMLLSHVIYWRTTVINRLNGTLDLPPFPDFALPESFTDENWKQLLKDFEATYHLLLNSINHFPEGKLHEQSPKKEQTYFELIMGCLQHDAYHLGQINLLRNLLV